MKVRPVNRDTCTTGLPAATDAQIAARCAALAHPARVAILRHLAQRDACCCKDVVSRLDLAQSTVSQHLKVLVEAGLVKNTPERPFSRYSLDREALDLLSTGLGSFIEYCCKGT